jgi:hypothetical protein
MALFRTIRVRIIALGIQFRTIRARIIALGIQFRTIRARIIALMALITLLIGLRILVTY